MSILSDSPEKSQAINFSIKDDISKFRFIILGTNGNLARSLGNILRVPKCDFLDRRQVARLFSSNIERMELGNRLTEIASKQKLFVLICAGETNPSSNVEDLFHLNVRLPLLIGRLLPENNSTLVTFGSVMESYLDEQMMNPYVLSKLTLTKNLTKQSQFNYVHFRVNTWYGGPNNQKHMLIGGIEHSLRARVPLRISSGTQLREYHHILDDCFAFLKILTTRPTTHIIEISSGENLTILRLCTEVLTYFNSLELLHVSGIPDPKGENYLHLGKRNEFVKDHFFRHSIMGIAAYLESILSR